MTRSVVQLGGQALKLDADGDTTIEVSSDDVLVVDTAGNEALKIDANGYVTKPLQCAFNVQASTNQNNIATASYVTVVYGQENYDIGGNFASNTFTAPVTGKYQLNAHLRLDTVSNDSTYYLFFLQTSNRGYYQTMDSNAVSLDYHSFALSLVADMDANDTATLSVYQQGGTQQTDIVGQTGSSTTNFSGYLLG